MTAFVHYAGTVPERSAPAAPVLMSPNGVKYEPAAFHLGVAQLLAAEARHLPLIQRQIHVLRGIAIQVVDVERALARGKVTGRIGVGAASGPASAVAVGRFLTPGSANTFFVGRAVTPGFGRAIGLVVQCAHTVNRVFRSQPFQKIKMVVRALEIARARAFPF